MLIFLVCNYILSIPQFFPDMYDPRPLIGQTLGSTSLRQFGPDDTCQNARQSDSPTRGSVWRILNVKVQTYKYLSLTFLIWKPFLNLDIQNSYYLCHLPVTILTALYAMLLPGMLASHLNSENARLDLDTYGECHLVTVTRLEKWLDSGF